MSMTVGELKDALEDFISTFDNEDDAYSCPVFLLEQPSWPFAYSIKGTTDLHNVIGEEFYNNRDDYISRDSSWEESEKAMEELVEDSKAQYFKDFNGYGEQSDSIFYILEGRQLRYATGAEKLALGE